MYVEKRKFGKRIKYYLVYSYREGGKVKKIRKYLGIDLSNNELEIAKKKFGKEFPDLVKHLGSEIFSFRLTKKQIDVLNKYNDRIKVVHLSENEWNKFTEDFVYNTNAIEGSTISEKEVSDILKKNLANRASADEIETKGVAKAVSFIRKTDEEISATLLLKLHGLCFEGSKSFSGKFREVNVVIRNSRGEILHAGVPKEELKDYLDDFVDWYKENKTKYKPLVLAAILHNQFEHIHPFQDGNGRVGRLLLNFILIKNKYPPINIMLEDRQEYYWTLQEYSRNDNLKPTLDFLIKQYKKTLKEVTTK